MSYQKSQKIVEGKTKIIWSIIDRSDLAIVENKSDITAFDDPSYTKNFKAKAEYATATTCRVFEILKKSGIPVAYEEQISTTEFTAPACEMIPLEVVARRYAVGSFLKRHPELTGQEGEAPHRFHRLVTEFFLKTTKGKLINYQGQEILSGLDPLKGEEDPLIVNPEENIWKLYYSKKPAWDENVNLNKTVEASKIIADNWSERVKEMENILRKVFLVLEGAWGNLGLRIIDLKIEFGIDQKGNLLVADVIDNDSWRLRDAEWQELSKQAFRDGEDLGGVEKKYGIVAALAQNFRVPRQALVLWRGSEGDAFPEVNVDYINAGLAIEKITLSGHKQTQKCLWALEKILSGYPDGGVIVAKVGRSNGLGPILSARTAWPVIAIPATMEENPEDIWSSVRMPSSVPLATAWPEANAILLAMEILGQKNPAIYAIRQMGIERLDE